MGRYIPDDILEEIRDKADIVEVVGSYISLKKRGSDYWGCCPFHHEKTPSFKVSNQPPVYYCFGCKKSGNVFHFVQEMENTDFPGACEFLAKRYSIAIPETGTGNAATAARKKKFKQDGFELLNAAAIWYQQILKTDPRADAARQYLASRGMDPASAEKFGLGFSLDSWDEFYKWGIAQGVNQDLMLTTGMLTQKTEDPDRVYDRFRGRLMFPIKDVLGRVVGFSARILDKDAKAAKYVNSPESAFFHKGEILYGLNIARTALKEHAALVCEGQMDVIACHRAGLAWAVAAQGTAFTEMHAKLLKKSTNKVQLAFDGDTAGMKATLRTIEILYLQGIEVTITQIPDGEDPDSIFRAGGGPALQQIMAFSEDAVPYIYKWSCEKYDAASPEGKSQIVEQVMRVIGSIQDEVIRVAHVQWLAKEMKLPEETLLRSLKAYLKTIEQQKENQERYIDIERSRQNHTDNTPISPPGFFMELPETQQDKITPVIISLLDLMVHYQEIAALIVKSNIAPLLPDLPIAAALNFALASVENGEWEVLLEDLADSNFVTIPGVGQVLNDSHFLQLNPAEKGLDKQHQTIRQNLLQRAVRDCVNKLTLVHLNKQYQEISENLSHCSKEEQDSLLRKLFAITKEKNALK
ncbi:MAG: DNA primase [Lentisphaeria bacterium]